MPNRNDEEKGSRMNAVLREQTVRRRKGTRNRQEMEEGTYLAGEDADTNEPRTKKPRFPKGKKTTAGEERLSSFVEGEEDEPIFRSADARAAAKERAWKRDSTGEKTLAEDIGVLPDVTKAEEDFEEETDELVEDGQVFEPFNLKQEREEGYFDAQGNYVEYRYENEGKDAWLENAEVDTRFAAKALADNKKLTNAKDDSLGKDELWVIKQRIADALEPGETVLRALRRLKGAPKNGTKKEKMSDANRTVFDQLTEDAVKLLDDGDYNVYEETKETFQREAEHYAAVARARAGISNGNATEISQASTATDMFGGDDVDEREPADQSLAAAAASTDLPGEGGNGHGQGVVNSIAPVREGGATPMDGSGYVYDDSSGYYFNSELGYYYDANSGMYSNASTGQWYIYDEKSTSYVEVSQ